MKDNKEAYSEAIETEVKDGVKLTDEELEGAAGGVLNSKARAEVAKKLNSKGYA